jgi:hypothetical protein
MCVNICESVFVVAITDIAARSAGVEGFALIEVAAPVS